MRSSAVQWYAATGARPAYRTCRRQCNPAGPVHLLPRVHTKGLQSPIVASYGCHVPHRSASAPLSLGYEAPGPHTLKLLAAARLATRERSPARMHVAHVPVGVAESTR